MFAVEGGRAVVLLEMVERCVFTGGVGDACGSGDAAVEVGQEPGQSVRRSHLHPVTILTLDILGLLHVRMPLTIPHHPPLGMAVDAAEVGIAVMHIIGQSVVRASIGQPMAEFALLVRRTVPLTLEDPLIRQPDAVGAVVALETVGSGDAGGVACMTVADGFGHPVTIAASAAAYGRGVVKECFVLIDMTGRAGFGEVVFGYGGGVALPGDIIHPARSVEVARFAPLVLEDSEDAALGLHERAREAVDNIRMTLDTKDPRMLQPGGIADDTPVGSIFVRRPGITPMTRSAPKRFDRMITVDGMGIGMASHTPVGWQMGSLSQERGTTGQNQDQKKTAIFSDGYVHNIRKSTLFRELFIVCLLLFFQKK